MILSIYENTLKEWFPCDIGTDNNKMIGLVISCRQLCKY